MQLRLAAIGCLVIAPLSSVPAAPTASVQTMQLNGAAGGPRFDGMGVVNGGGATSVLLKDYPEPQRSQILDLVYKPKFGASVSALLVEIPGDGNSTQGSMPSHMHTRDDLDYTRGYTWWILREAKKRNPDLSLDGAAWSAPGWVGNGNFWSQDAADYYVKWLQGLRSVYGLEFDALGCRNEMGVSFDFAKQLRASLDANGFGEIKIHAFDDWPKNKFDFVKNLLADEKARDAIAILGAHTLAENPASAEVRELAAKMGKPIWNTEEHVYLKGFDCAISVVKAFNENHIRSGATRIVNWYDIAGVYPIEPYAEDPAALLAWSPWSGNYQVREALWGYAHYGQFTKIGWHYLESGCGPLDGGGTVATFKSPTGDDYSIILETKGAEASQQVRFQIGGGLPAKPLCVWRSDEKAQFVQQPGITPTDGAFTITLEPNAIYSLSTTTGQQKGSFANIPAAKPFPFPYYETFEEYTDPKIWGLLPRYTADISGAFELADRPDGKGKCLRQVVPVRTISWAQPDWLPYTILGDDQWQDYEVGVDVCLNPGDSAGVMGRINHIGAGYGFNPKGYFLQLSADGECRLVVIRGKTDKNKTTGDAEQQALIKAGKDEGEGGEKVLGTVRVPGIAPGQWHNLKLSFKGSSIAAFVDDKPVLSTTDNFYSHGMAGLLAGGGEQKKLSTPWFDNLLIKAGDAPMPKPATLAPGQSPLYGAQPSVASYILTPPAPASPRINGASVFGVRPGSPFLFTIAATGDRPMSFSAQNLPEGLKLDPATGRITGALAMKGEHIVMLGAKNSLGSVEKKFRIVCGDQIALTPPMGWNSWNCFAHEVSADKVKAAADVLVKSGLANHGWTYVNIDDFWQNNRDSQDPRLQGPVRDTDGFVVPNARFPDMKGLADYVHGLGLKIGLYSSPGPWTCGGCAGSFQHEQQDAQTYAKWGFDYFKYDWCSYGGIADGKAATDKSIVSWAAGEKGKSDVEVATHPYRLMGKFLREQKRDIVFSVCQYGMSDVWKWGASVDGNCWRTTYDITDTWESMSSIGFDQQDKAAPFAKPGNWNDPDMLVVGHVGWGNPHPTRLTPDEQYTHMSLWCLLASPLLIGCDLEKLDDFTLSLLTNDEVLAIDQDPLGKQATCVIKDGDLRVYARELEDGSRAVGFFNLGVNPMELSFKDFAKLDLAGRQATRDLWRQKNLAAVDTPMDSLPLAIPAHGVVLCKFTTVK